MKQYGLIESILRKEDNKVNVEFLQIQVPLVPVVELVLFTIYTSSDDDDDGYYDNYISRALLCSTGPVNQQYFTIQDAANMGLRPDYKSNGRGCWICPLGYLYVPAAHPPKKEFHEALLTFANK